jgi:hypothetical protein
MLSLLEVAHEKAMVITSITVRVYTMKIQWNGALHMNNLLLIDMFLNDKEVNIENVCTYTTMFWIYYENLWKNFNESKVSKSIFKIL